MPRLYKIWPSNNRFLPCGCILGPIADTCANLCVYISMVVAVILYFIFAFDQIWQINPVLPLLFFISLFISILFLILTQCSDPGIIPRRPFLEEDYSKYALYLDQRTENNEAKRFCSTCKIYKPARTSHCSICNNCVQVYDHHCPFVNNCIGKRNYRFFVCFLGSIVLTFMIYIGNIGIFLLNKSGGSVNSSILIIICSIVLAILALPLIGFLIFHIYLVLSGRTTKEVLKSLNEEKQQVQWCNVDPSIIDYFKEMSKERLNELKHRMDTIHFEGNTKNTNINDLEQRMI